METLPLNGAMFAVSWARRSTWGRQSFPRKLLLSTNVYGALRAVVFDDLLAAAPDVRAAVRAVASATAMPRLTTLLVRKRLRSTSLIFPPPGQALSLDGIVPITLARA